MERDGDDTHWNHIIEVVSLWYETIEGNQMTAGEIPIAKIALLPKVARFGDTEFQGFCLRINFAIVHYVRI